MSDERQTKSGILENHVQTVLTSLILAAIIWVASTTSGVASTVAVLKAELRAANEKIDTLKADRYTKSQAAADLAIRDYRLDKLEHEVDQLKEK
jgi:uncharacterized protein YlxW (UPF0749 family)